MKEQTCNGRQEIDSAVNLIRSYLRIFLKIAGDIVHCIIPYHFYVLMGSFLYATLSSTMFLFTHSPQKRFKYWNFKQNMWSDGLLPTFLRK